MNRRNFLCLAGSSLTLACAHPLATTNIAPPLRRAARLHQGDDVMLVAPGGFVTTANVETAANNMRALGLVPHFAPNVLARWGGYAGTVAQRVDDLHTAFSKPNIRAVWPIRGGSGTSALLPHLDYGLIAAHPKILIGYSDITALHCALLAKAQLTTFHGPVALSTFTEYTASAVRRTLFSPAPRCVFTRSPQHDARIATDPAYQPRALNANEHAAIEGRLTGGNLSVYTSLLGTEYVPTLPDSLMFFEDVSEPPYRIDRMLTQWQQASAAQSVRGVALGVFQRALPTDQQPSLSLDEVLGAQFTNAPYPAGYGFSFGHVADQMVLPLGIRASIDTRTMTLTLLEAGVL